MNKRKIFYDMDNTIAIFSIKGREGEALERMFEKGFFANLPIMQDVQETLAGLMYEGHEVFLLSACINSPYCKVDKMKWIEKYLPFIPEENIYLVPVGTNKAEAIGNVENAYLVDDYSKNLIEWEQAGGIPVKKRFSNKSKWKNIVKNHMDIFEIINRKEVK